SLLCPVDPGGRRPGERAKRVQQTEGEKWRSLNPNTFFLTIYGHLAGGRSILPIHPVRSEGDTVAETGQ
ncbi:MAG TPA: hypothetical protein VGQ49_23705, partial [Bryobacteraceae bacterium]|nr:hypothetical protein [Bryobacteraceae bacterium]